MERDGTVMAVRRNVLLERLTCPICSKTYKEATTITECLHSFCKDCIYKTFEDEELQSCPKCNKFLGASPLRSLRPDHQLQSLVAKLLPKLTTKLTPGKILAESEGKCKSSSAKRQKREEDNETSNGEGSAAGETGSNETKD